MSSILSNDAESEHKRQSVLQKYERYLANAPKSSIEHQNGERYLANASKSSIEQSNGEKDRENADDLQEQAGAPATSSSAPEQSRNQVLAKLEQNWIITNWRR